MNNIMQLWGLRPALFAVVLVVSSSAANASGVIVGTTNDSNCIPFGCFRSNVTEYQQAYSSTALSTPIRISSLTFYNTFTDFGGVLSPGVYNLYLSTTSAPIDGLSTTFASNIGSDQTLVFSSTLPAHSQISPGGHFDFLLMNGFSYSPSAGNLLLTVMSPNDAVADTPLDSQNHSGLMSRVYGSGTTGSTDGTGLVTGFNVATFQAPEIDPTSTASGLTVLFATMVVLRGRRRIR